MPSDPLTDFVKGEYSRQPSRLHVKLAIIVLVCVSVIFSMIAIWMAASATNEVRPSNNLVTAEAIVVSKKRARRIERRHGRGQIIHWRFVEGYDPAKRSFSGYDKVSRSFGRSLDVGDIISVQYDPDKPRRPENVRIKGSIPIWYFFWIIGLCLLSTFCAISGFWRVRLALTERQKFVDILSKNLSTNSP